MGDDLVGKNIGKPQFLCIYLEILIHNFCYTELYCILYTASRSITSWKLTYPTFWKRKIIFPTTVERKMWVFSSGISTTPWKNNRFAPYKSDGRKSGSLPFGFRSPNFRGKLAVKNFRGSFSLLKRLPLPTGPPATGPTKKPSPEGCTPQTTPLPSWQPKLNALPSRRNSPGFVGRVEKTPKNPTGLGNIQNLPRPDSGFLSDRSKSTLLWDFKKRRTIYTCAAKKTICVFPKRSNSLEEIRRTADLTFHPLPQIAWKTSSVSLLLNWWRELQPVPTSWYCWWKKSHHLGWLYKTL